MYIMVFLFCFVGVHAQGINGTQHDFKNDTNEDWNIPEEVCMVCHISDDDFENNRSPLWNIRGDIKKFTPYGNLVANSANIESDIGSKLCLSCHDGTVAEDNLGIIANNKKTYSKHFILNNIVSGEHPVSISYQNNKNGLYNHINTLSGLGNSINQDMLFHEKLECASCHDVHNLDGSSKLLRIKNTKSELCLTCHNK